MLALALIVIGYVALRVLRPAFVLAQDRAMRLAPQVGIIAGIMQGAVGISAPISVSFLNAMRLDRSVFIPTVAIFFIAMSLSQTSVLVGHGVLTSSVASVSLIAMMGQLAAMALGNRLARNMSAQLFDRIVLVVLLAMAARMIWTSLSA